MSRVACRCSRSALVRASCASGGNGGSDDGDGDGGDGDD
jgi:hypothetical protein